MLVDLPGYGYAKVPLDVKKQWGPMMGTYLSKRDTLRGVVLILDVRRMPSAEDLQMLDLLRSNGIPPILVITKCDKVSRSERKRQMQVISRTLQVQEADFLFFSALSREGIDDVWGAIEPLLTNPQPV
jgi:GTP-binding protein